MSIFVCVYTCVCMYVYAEYYQIMEKTAWNKYVRYQVDIFKTHTATYCNILQHDAAQCNALQYASNT